jgi:elongation factor 3
MHDTKREVSTQAFKTMQVLCKLAGNPDIDPHIPLLIECMQNPDNVSKTVLTLSSTTFVAEVTGPALSLMVPLLVRALNDRSASVMRPTVVIANNLFKLVRNPPDAGQFMNQLLPGLDRIIETAAFPEIRDLALQARNTLVEAAGGETAVGFQVDTETVLKDVNAYCKKLKIFLGPVFKLNISFLTVMVSRFVSKECYKLVQWEHSLFEILEPAMPRESKKLISFLHEKYHSEYMKTQVYGDDGDDEGELLCDLEFSLAYGGMMLLNNTRLRLRRGQRYGLCGANGAGKSTLMRAISLGKVDGFPTQDQLKCVFVEHALQGDDAGLSVIDFLSKDPQLKGKKREKISAILEEVGFTSERQAAPVGSLSGGWKMKLELARAMIIEADILLLDEPTNHLDVANVKWLENYLNTHTEITSLIVSHDSGFLDNVCTFITHYEKKKLVYYKGNLEK